MGNKHPKVHRSNGNGNGYENSKDSLKVNKPPIDEVIQREDTIDDKSLTQNNPININPLSSINPLQKKIKDWLEDYNNLHPSLIITFSNLLPLYLIGKVQSYYQELCEVASDEDKSSDDKLKIIYYLAMYEKVDIIDIIKKTYNPPGLVTPSKGDLICYCPSDGTSFVLDNFGSKSSEKNPDLGFTSSAKWVEDSSFVGTSPKLNRIGVQDYYIYIYHDDKAMKNYEVLNEKFSLAYPKLFTKMLLTYRVWNKPCVVREVMFQLSPRDNIRTIAIDILTIFSIVHKFGVCKSAIDESIKCLIRRPKWDRIFRPLHQTKLIGDIKNMIIDYVTNDEAFVKKVRTHKYSIFPGNIYICDMNQNYTNRIGKRITGKSNLIDLHEFLSKRVTLNNNDDVVDDLMVRLNKFREIVYLLDHTTRNYNYDKMKKIFTDDIFV